MEKRKLREHCFKMLFSTDFYPESESETQLRNYFDSPNEEDMDEEGNTILEHTVECSELEEELLQKRVEDIREKLADIDKKISTGVIGWKLTRMGKVERNIIRLAVYEIFYDEDIPERVAINEAVLLARTYGGEDARVFVNGVLAKLV